MPYRLDIPGHISLFHLRAIELVATLVPPGGHVVEVGSLFGRSGYAWGASVDPSVTVHCLDPWEDNEDVRALEERHGIRYGIDQFRAYLRDLPNVKPHRGHSPHDFRHWKGPIDLYYEDAVHTDPVLSQNIRFWSERVRPGGILCGADYRPGCPNVQQAVARLASQWNRDLIVVDRFWCLLPPESLCPGADEIAQKLKDLNREAQHALDAKGLLLRIGPRQPVQAPDRHGQITIKGQMFLESLKPWPARPRKKMSVGVRMVPEHSPEIEVLNVLTDMPTSQLRHDVVETFDLTFSADLLTPGTYRAVFDMHARNIGWLLNAHVDRARAPLIRISGGMADLTATAPLPEQSDWLSLSDVIDLSAKGNGTRFKKGGWVRAEAAYSWTTGEKSELHVRIPAHEAARLTGLMMYVTLRPLVYQQALTQQRLTIRCGRAKLYHRTLKKRETLAVRIPAKLFQNGRNMPLVFEHPDFARPIDLSPDLTDRKPLAFAVETIRFVPVVDMPAVT